MSTAKSTSNQPTRDPNVHAVLHRAGRSWRGLIVRIVPGGRAPDLVATREFPLEAGTTLESWLDEYQVSEVIGVLPASSVICRTCSLPDAPEEQLEPALRLQAEAHLFGIAPSHRMAMSVLPAARADSGRAGLILAWPESAEVTPPPTGRRVHWAPDVVGLATLLNGDRPTRPLLWIDRTPGAVAMALSHEGGAVFRAIREDADDDQEWGKSIGRALAETALNLGQTSAFVTETVREIEGELRGIQTDDARLIAPREITENAGTRMSRLGNQTEAWWSTYGIAVGVALARAGTLAPLTRLEDDPPTEKPSPIRRAVTALSQPQTATLTVVACVLLLMFGTMVFNGLQYAVLSLRYSDIDERLAAVNLTQNKIEVYRELQRGGWSVTKVLSDVASNTPEGIELEQMRVNQTQTFAVTGRALPTDDRSATELINVMQSNLIQSGIFENINFRWGDRDAFGAVEFDLSATLKQPYQHVEYREDLDFRLQTLRERRYGPPPDLDRPTETASTQIEEPSFPGTDPRGETGRDTAVTDAGTRPTADPDDDDDDDDRQATGRRPDSDRGQGSLFGDADSPGDDRGSGLPASFEMPEPMSEEQIMALSSAEVRDRLVRVSQARRYTRNRSDNEELREQLEKEFQLLMSRMRGDQ